MANRDLPPAQGLYDPRFEHDSCGVGFVVDMQGRKTRTLVDQALYGAVQPQPPRRGRRRARHRRRRRDPRADARRVCTGRSAVRAAAGRRVRDRHRVPSHGRRRGAPSTKVEKVLADEGFTVLGWRDVPIGADVPGAIAREVMPAFRQVFVTKDDLAGDELERHVYVARKRIEHEHRCVLPVAVGARRRLQGDAHARPARAVLRATSRDERFESALCLVHSRLQHQHVPVVAARAPVPHARPQRRDQHRAGQRELDARA